MIKIEFTCKTCNKTMAITAGDIDEKTIVPVCDACYKMFLARKGKLIKSFEKKLVGAYEEYGIPVDTFRASEEFGDLNSG